MEGRKEFRMVVDVRGMLVVSEVSKRKDPANRTAPNDHDDLTCPTTSLLATPFPVCN
jgi:hypothetical protein